MKFFLIVCCNTPKPNQQAIVLVFIAVKKKIVSKIQFDDLTD